MDGVFHLCRCFYDLAGSGDEFDAIVIALATVYGRGGALPRMRISKLSDSTSPYPTRQFDY